MSAEKTYRKVGGLPRFFEGFLASLLLLVASPILVLVAAAVALTSPGGVFFRQRRVGRGGKLFTLLKLRTMRTSRHGAHVTAADDQRITAIGRWLRRTKVDELPELWNVVRGEMSLVGPRPEVPAHVELEDPLWKRVLAARPGLTDPITLRLRHEEELLAEVSGDRDVWYAKHLQPFKLRGYVDYLDRRTAFSDLKILWATFTAVLLPARYPPPTVAEIEREAHRCGS